MVSLDTDRKFRAELVGLMADPVYEQGEVYRLVLVSVSNAGGQPYKRTQQVQVRLDSLVAVN
jgi:hypothetical protein